MAPKKNEKGNARPGIRAWGIQFSATRRSISGTEAVVCLQRFRAFVDRLSFSSHPHSALTISLVYPRKHKGRQQTIDWHNPEAVKHLNQAILFSHGITIYLPQNHLVPTFASRFSYIRKIHDLVAGVSSQQPRGVDIGTGTSAIYALLGAKLMGWRFVATDTNEESVEWARRNVAANGLQQQIDVRYNRTRTVFTGVIERLETFDFSMCNPPFFEDPSQARANPKRASTATDEEAVTEGGEVEFVGKMIEESACMLGGMQVRWWTSLLGRKSSVKPLKRKLFGLPVAPRQVKVDEFTQGRITRCFTASGLCQSIVCFRTSTFF